MNRRLRIIRLACILCVITLIVSSVWVGFLFVSGNRVPVFESRANYHLRMLRYHGKESKNAEAQIAHAQAFMEEPEALSFIFDEIKECRYDGRYHPGPFTMLRDFGAAGHQEVLHRLGRAESPAERFALATAALICFDDLTSLDDWIDAAQQTDWESTRKSSLLQAVNQHLLELGFPDDPPLLADKTGPTDPFNPQYIAWWAANKANWGARPINNQ